MPVTRKIHRLPEIEEKYPEHYGYNRGAVLAAMAMAGYESSPSGLAVILGSSYQYAYNKLRYGSFSRYDIAIMQDRCSLSPTQIALMFADGYNHEEYDGTYVKEGRNNARKSFEDAIKQINEQVRSEENGD